MKSAYLRRWFWASGIVAFVALAVVILALHSGDVETAKPKVTRLQMENLGRAIESYVKQNGALPTTKEGLTVLVRSRDGSAPFLARVPHDAWGDSLLYFIDEPGMYRIVSKGPDGVLATDDDLVYFGQVNLPRQ